MNDTKKIEDGGLAYPLVFMIPQNSRGPDGHIAALTSKGVSDE